MFLSRIAEVGWGVCAAVGTVRVTARGTELDRECGVRNFYRSTISILPQAIGSVTCAGIGPSDATVEGSLVSAGTPWM
jgi:hypothetical protein